MADARMPDEFYDLVAHHLPPEQPTGPKGGRPWIYPDEVLAFQCDYTPRSCQWDGEKK